MRATAISARDIDDELRARWRELQQTNPSLRSPYFAVEYTDAVASVRDDVFVLVAEHAGEILALLPYQMRRRGIAEPVGGRMSDYHGLISAPGTIVDVEAMLRAADLRVFEFHHLLADQVSFCASHRAHDDSQILDLGAGFEDYLRLPKVKRGNHLREIRRRARKFETDVAPTRLVECSSDESAFHRVLEWKSEQCRRTGVPEFLRWGWTEAMLRRIWETTTPDFGGILSVLYSGDRVAAAHFGMRSRSVLHWWFPVYDADFRRYSPGGQLLYRMAEWGADHGFAELDLGKGEEDYKRFFATSTRAVAVGAVRVPSATGAIHRVRVDSEAFVRESPHAEPLRRSVRALRRRRRARATT